MKKIILIVIAAVLIAAGGFLFFSLNQKSRNEMHLRMTEISEETLAAIPTETPLPTETPVPIETPVPLPEITEIPEIAPEPTALPLLDPADWQNWPELPNAIDPEIKAMYFEGLSEGNNPKRFSKIGDSNTMMPSFLGCFDSGIDTGYVLGPYAFLQEAIDNFQWSFSRNSRASRNGSSDPR